MPWEAVKSCSSGFTEYRCSVCKSIEALGRDPVQSDRMSCNAKRNARYSEDDPKLWDEMKQMCDAFMYVAAPSSSTTSYAFQWSAKLEKMGLPGTVVNFDDLDSVGDTTSSRWGARLRRSSFVYPPETMNKQAYAEALSRAVDNLTRPLTPEEKATGVLQAWSMYRPIIVSIDKWR